MLQTTLMKHRHQMKTTPIENCHDGLGRINCTRVLDRNDPGTTYLKLFHDDILPPGISIGIHTHRNECEYYYILSGSGVMTLDGVEHPVQAGDLTAVFPGGSHGLENRSEQDMRIMVIGLEVKKPS